MKQLSVLILFCIILCRTFKVQAQDWDDFDPPPPTEYGGPVPGGAEPPPPPNPGYETPAPGIWDLPAPGRAAVPTSSKGTEGLGPVNFKRTGKKRDLSKKNSRKEELLKENP